MSIAKHSKLNSLQRDLPEGFLASSAWLKKKNYSDQLLKKYRDAGWMESPARGVYRRPGPPLKWQHVVASLQNLLAFPVHVGGLTALEIQGYGHFVRMSGVMTIHLYSLVRLPSWLAKLPLQDKFVVHRERLFDEEEPEFADAGINVARDASAHATPLRAGLRQIVWGEYDRPITYSTAERAMLELLDEVPQRQSVEHAALLMQGLADLSSSQVLALLAVCRSIKAKRLFLALASRHRHHWVAPVVEAADRGEVELGKGKRSLVPGGKLHPKYLITLPEESDVRG
ncbi:MAG: type IV toxin-antitoxin system AbiEi family antitoxin domain-containing protein [Burkholderiales bacterium]|nr:type IV toxin-antitoxin system AbiEi family antitoxin domain-containing protein [Burkholderiales bacterium]